MTRRSDSASSFSPIAVDPVMSEKRTVTVLRVSAVWTSGSAAPHSRQNLARTGFSAPQVRQDDTRRVYDGAVLSTTIAGTGAAPASADQGFAPSSLRVAPRSATRGQTLSALAGEGRRERR